MNEKETEESQEDTRSTVDGDLKSKLCLAITINVAARSLNVAVKALEFYAKATIPEFSNDVSYQLIDGANRIRTGRNAREALEEIRVHVKRINELELEYMESIK